MKSGLKRIEATLDQLHTQHPITVDLATEPQAMAQIITSNVPRSLATASAKPTVKTIQPFPIPRESTTQHSTATQHLTASAEAPLSQPQPSRSHPTSAKPGRSINRSGMKVRKPGAIVKSAPSQPIATQPVAAQKAFPTRNSDPETPTLPKSKPPSFSSHRHAANPNLAVGILKEVESVVVKWQLELEQAVLEIQALYMEGPIVDGWLESHPYGSPQVMQPIGTAMLRHAEIDRLMEYVEEICRVPQTLETGEVPRTGYRLCGLDAEGQLWSRPCPAQQVPYVGLAIARYQKLRILLAQKQTLENRLNQLVQSLTLLHGQIQSHV